MNLGSLISRGAAVALCVSSFVACDDAPAVTATDVLGPDSVADTAPDTAPDTVADAAGDTGATDAITPDVVADAAGPDANTPDAEAETTSCSLPAESVVTLQTTDGVQLEADFYSSGVPNGPAVVLLHMIPPSNDRTNYPASFRQQLVDRGVTVLNVDRRGAGGSSGSASEAYTGPNGKLDAAAAMAFLATTDCAVDLARVGIVGASNGTTTALDYTVYAAAESAAPSPAALVFLTGGGYTENQNTVDAQRAILEPLPMLFVYSNVEATWSAQFQATAPGSWKFDEYTPGGHGTNMFGVQAASAAAVADWLEANL